MCPLPRPATRGTGAARQWFRTDSLEKTDFQVASCQTLQEVHKFLTHNRPIQGAWKTIHLVVHGNQWTGMRVPVQKGGERSTAALVNTAVDKGVFPALPEGHFDSNTTLIIDGCNIGQDSALLTALGRAFQGAQVSSPPYFNIFEANGENGYSQGVQHYLADSRYIVFPAGIYPGNRAVAKELATRYPNDTTNWSVALQQLRPRFPGAPYVHYFSIPVHWTTLYTSTQTTPTLLTDEDGLQWVKSQPELLREIQEMGLQPESFRWSTEVIDYPDGWLGGVRPAIAAEGMAMIYCVLKPLVEMVL